MRRQRKLIFYSESQRNCQLTKYLDLLPRTIEEKKHSLHSLQKKKIPVLASRYSRKRWKMRKREQRMRREKNSRRREKEEEKRKEEEEERGV